MHPGSRREFLKTAASAAASVAISSAFPPGLLAAARSSTSAIKKGLVYDMLATQLSAQERLQMARDAGFEVVQVPTTPDESAAEQLKSAADKANIRIDSVMNMHHWNYPLSSSDPTVVKNSLAGMRASLHNAKLWGAASVLLVPAVVNSQTSYRDAWTRSQQQIRKLIWLAAELKIVIAIENVWNKFLLSPIEMARYVQEFHSPWVKVWFDVGNVLPYGYPQDWIRILSNDIVNLHIKDFKVRDECYAPVNLGDGDVDWAEVRKALSQTGYVGSAIAELKGGDERFLRDLSRRMDRLVLGGD